MTGLPNIAYGRHVAALAACIALAMAAVVALPVIRNSQYTYHKFYVLWPVLMAIASTKAPPKLVLAVAAIVLALNSALLARDVVAAILVELERHDRHPGAGKGRSPTPLSSSAPTSRSVRHADVGT